MAKALCKWKKKILNIISMSWYISSVSLGLYPSELKKRILGQLSEPYTRRIFLLMVTPLKKDATK